MFFHHEYISAFDYMGSFFASAFDIFLGFGLGVVLLNFVMPNHKVMAKEIGVTIPLIIIAAYVMVKTFTRGKRLVSKEFWHFSLSLSLPNIIYIVSQDIIAYSDRIFISQYFGYEVVGIYSVVHYLGLFMTLLWSGANGFWTPWLFEKLKNNQTDLINKNLKRYLTAFSALTIITCALLPLAIKYILPGGYVAGIKIVVPIVLSGFFMCLYSMMANLEFYHKKGKYIVISTVAAAVIDIILNLIFIKLYGYEAAAYTTLAGCVLMFLLHTIVSHKILKIDIYKLRYFAVSIAVTCVLCTVIGILWVQYM